MGLLTSLSNNLIIVLFQVLEMNNENKNSINNKKNNSILNTLRQKLIKNLPENNYYTFANRRMYAKFRRLGYFVPECEKLYNY